MTRWHGTTMDTGFVAQALATARTALGLPRDCATSEYVRVLPRGIRCSYCQARRWNAVACRSSGSSNRGCFPSMRSTISRTQRWNESVAGAISARGYFFFQAEDGIRDYKVTGVQTCALPI